MEGKIIVIVWDWCMGDRKVVAQELAKLFNAFSHPDRIRMVEELGRAECDVQGLSETLEISSSRVSQHLALFRSLRIVHERREGKHHFYSLVEPNVANWILEGLRFTELGVIGSPTFDKAVEQALKVWGKNDE